MTASPPRFVRRPTLASGLVGLLVAVAAVGLIAETPAQRRALATAAVGVASFAAGGRLWHRGRAVLGPLAALLGSLLVVAAAADAVTRPARFVERLELLPGILGLWLLAAALVPVRFRWSRLLADAGAALLFVAVLTSGVVYGASPTALVIAGVGTVVAWDAAGNAVSMGGQLGADRGAATAGPELVHVALSGAVGAAAVLSALAVERLGVAGLPFPALLALLVAGVALALVSHR